MKFSSVKFFRYTVYTHSSSLLEFFSCSSSAFFASALRFLAEMLMLEFLAESSTYRAIPHMRATTKRKVNHCEQELSEDMEKLKQNTLM